MARTSLALLVHGDLFGRVGGTRSSAMSQVWTEAFRVERRGIDVRAGLAGAVASCAPPALGVALGEPAIG